MCTFCRHRQQCPWYSLQRERPSETCYSLHSTFHVHVRWHNLKQWVQASSCNSSESGKWSLPIMQTNIIVFASSLTMWDGAIAGGQYKKRWYRSVTIWERKSPKMMLQAWFETMTVTWHHAWGPSICFLLQTFVVGLIRYSCVWDWSASAFFPTLFKHAADKIWW